MPLTRRAGRGDGGNMHGIGAMASKSEIVGESRGGRWRIAVWGFAIFLLLLPAIAMRFTPEVDWTASDFIVFGAMLALALGAYEFVARLPGNAAYRIGFGLAIVTSFFLVWANLAVGIVGSENNAANLMYVGVLAVVAAGAFASRFTADGMMRTTIAAAVLQALIAGIALADDMGLGDPNWPKDTLGATGLFVGLWLVSSGLFRVSQRS